MAKRCGMEMRQGEQVEDTAQSVNFCSSHLVKNPLHRHFFLSSVHAFSVVIGTDMCTNTVGFVQSRT